jgi:integrase
MTKVNLTKKLIDNIEATTNEQVFYDIKTTGLHLKVSPAGKKGFYLYFRTQNGEQKRPKLGDFGVMALEQARDKARVMLGELAKGNDPTKQNQIDGVTLSQFYPLFVKDHFDKHIKPSTTRTYHSLLTTVILPALGKRRLDSITRSDVEAMMNRNDNRRTTANHALVLLKLMLDKAQQWELMPPALNACSNISKFKTQPKKRYLSNEERAKLINTLNQFERAQLTQQNAITLIRLLMMTGCRKNEIVMLRWDELQLDEGVLRLKDSKTGRKDVILSKYAINILQTALNNHSEYVFPGKDGIKPIQGLQKIWERVRKTAGLDDVRIHDLRHTFASVAVSNGIPLYEVGRLLGHASMQSTQRYAHLDRSCLQKSLNKFSNKLI